MSKNLIMFLLNSGQEVIAELVAETDPSHAGAFRVCHALVLHVVQTGPTAYGLQMSPLSPANPEGELAIYNASIVGRTISIPDDLASAYVQRTSKIQIVSSLPGLT